jgi:hypothetical protein
MSVRQFSSSSIRTGAKSTKFWDQVTSPYGTFDLIETATVTSNVSSVSFSNLGTYASAYKNLRIIVRALDTATSNNTWINLQFNNDTASNYYRGNIRFSDTNTTGSIATTESTDTIGLSATRDNPAGGDTLYGVIAVANISDYSSTTKYKNVISFGGQIQSNGWALGLWNGVYKSTNAITSITVRPDGTLNFRDNSRIYLYGMKG